MRYNKLEYSFYKAVVDMLKKTFLPIYAVSFCVGLLFATNSVVNLIWKDTIYPIPELHNSFFINDYINLFLGVPILLVSLIMARHAKKIGLVGWVSSLMFVLYNEIAYLFAVRNLYSQIMNGGIVLLGFVVLIALIKSLDYQKLIHDVSPIRWRKAYGAVLVIMGLVFVARAAVNIINVINGSVSLTLSEIGVNIADIIICLFWVISGILMAKKSTYGYIMGLISYFHGALLFISLIIFMAMQPIVCGTHFVAADFLVIAIMSLTFLIPVIQLMHKFVKQEASHIKQ